MAGEAISAEVLLQLVERVLLADPARACGADGIVALALDVALEATGAERGFALLVDREGGECFVARNLDPSDSSAVDHSVVELVRQSGRPFMVGDAAATSGPLAASARELGVRSVLCAPLRSLEEDAAPFGAIYLDHRARAGAFGAGEQELLVAFAARVAAHLRICVDLERRERGLAAREGALRRASLEQDQRWRLEHAVARSPAMQRTLAAAARARECDLPVLIHGPIGSGRERLARGIHRGGARATGPFVALEARAIPEGGWPPLLERAHGGTLFLEEPGQLSPAGQAELLRALESPLDVRVIASTSEDLTRLARDGAFLAALQVEVPALRERLEDIPELCERLIAELAAMLGVPARPLSRAALERVLGAPWPGNLRQLSQTLARALLRAAGPEIRPGELASEEPEPDDFRAAEERWKRAFFSRLLRESGGNVSEAARRAGIARRSFHRLLTRMGIEG